MRALKDRREIAQEINIKRTTTVRIDLAEADSYGIKSQNINIDNGTFKDGVPYLIEAQIYAYSDEKKFVFSSHCVCLHNSFDYHDIEEMAEYANAPVVKPDSDVVLVIVDSEKKVAYTPVVLHTGKRVYAHCSTPLEFIDEDNDASYFMYQVKDEIFNQWVRF